MLVKLKLEQFLSDLLEKASKGQRDIEQKQELKPSVEKDLKFKVGKAQSNKENLDKLESSYREFQKNGGPELREYYLRQHKVETSK